MSHPPESISIQQNLDSFVNIIPTSTWYNFLLYIYYNNFIVLYVVFTNYCLKELKLNLNRYNEA